MKLASSLVGGTAYRPCQSVIGNKWSDAARLASVEARRRSMMARQASKDLEGHGHTEDAMREAGLGLSRANINAYGLAAIHHQRAAAEHRKLAGIDQSAPLAHMNAAGLHDDAARANLVASNLTEHVHNAAYAPYAVTGQLRNFSTGIVSNDWDESKHPRVEKGGPGGGEFTSAAGGPMGAPAASAQAQAIHDSVKAGKDTGKHTNGEGQPKGFAPEEMSSAMKGWAEQHYARSPLHRVAESPDLYGLPRETSHGEGHGEDHGHEEGEPVWSHGVHLGHGGLDTYRWAVHTISGVQEALGGKAASAGGAARGVLGAKAAGAYVGEQAGHAAQAHGHVIGGHGEEGLAGGQEGAHGEGGHHWAQAAEAVGAIYGAKASASLEKLGGLDKKAEELYERMKVEHGAAAPYLHVAATAGAVGLKMVLAHALAGPIGMGLGAAAGMLSGGAVGLGKAGVKGAIRGGLFGAATGAATGMLAGHGESILSGLGEGMASTITEGIKGFGSFMTPGIGLATLYVAHLVGKLGKTLGLYRLGKGLGLGEAHRWVAGTRLAHGAEHLLHRAAKGFETFTDLPIEVAKSVAGAAGRRLRSIGSKASERLRVPPATTIAPGYLHNSLVASIFYRHPVTNIIGAVNGDNRQQPALDLHNPGIQMVIQLVQDAVGILRQTPLWDKINTPEGAKLVASLLAA